MQRQKEVQLETIKISLKETEARLTKLYLNTLVEYLKRTDLTTYNQIKDRFFQNLNAMLPVDEDIKSKIEETVQVEVIRLDAKEALQTIIENMIEKY